MQRPTGGTSLTKDSHLFFPQKCQKCVLNSTSVIEKVRFAQLQYYCGKRSCLRPLEHKIRIKGNENGFRKCLLESLLLRWFIGRINVQYVRRFCSFFFFRCDGIFVLEKIKYSETTCLNSISNYISKKIILYKQKKKL